MLNYHAFVTHVIDSYPHEACGVVVQGEFIPCENISDSPEDSFELDSAVQAKYGDSISLIVHSHISTPNDPVDPRTPSKEDMEAQVAADIEFGIVSTDGLDVTPMITWGNPKNRPPLLEREFVFNAQDCFSLCADWTYQNRGIVLPEVPRDWFWQSQGVNPFIELYGSFGFVDVSLGDIQEGDWILFNRRAPEGICNHAAIYLGNDQILHHEYKRLSCIDDLYRHSKYILKVIRHRGSV